MPLVRTSTGVTDIVSVGANANDFGVTSPPGNFKTPDFNINCQQTNKGWFSMITVIQRPAEGSNTSYYLTEGMYASGFMLQGGILTNYVVGPKNKEMYRIISKEIARLSRMAEEEHCRDIIHAYDITLKSVGETIDSVWIKLNNERKYYAKRKDAIFAVRNELKSASSHAKISKIFQDVINVEYNVDRVQLKNKLGDLYLRAADLTQNRDNQGWHSFQINRVGKSNSPLAWASYFKSENRDCRDVIRGALLNVPGAASNVVIDLNLLG